MRNKRHHFGGQVAINLLFVNKIIAQPCLELGVRRPGGGNCNPAAALSQQINGTFGQLAMDFRSSLRANGRDEPRLALARSWEASKQDQQGALVRNEIRWRFCLRHDPCFCRSGYPGQEDNSPLMRLWFGALEEVPQDVAKLKYIQIGMTDIST